jgi:hypothetical protein
MHQTVNAGRQRDRDIFQRLDVRNGEHATRVRAPGSVNHRQMAPRSQVPPQRANDSRLDGYWLFSNTRSPSKTRTFEMRKLVLRWVWADT